MKPGGIYQADFRKSTAGQDNHAEQKTLRIVQWNIERGYELDKVIEELRAIDADVLGLQEIDIGCERSGCEDTGVRIAEALGLNYIFVCEFEELHSELRDQRSQGGRPGFHGNAILSKFDISDARPVEHRYHPVDWENPKHNLALKEPRRGRRLTLAATMHTPQGDLLCYSAHLEVFCGMLARIRQFADILRDSKERIAEGLTHQVICGDLNTMGHGIARLSPSFCLDQMRFWSIGQTEAEFWHNNIMLQPDPAFQPEQDGQPGPRKAHMNKRLLRWGLGDDICTDALNPGFSDPFDPATTITLCNPVYPRLGLFLKGKLDWLLLRRCTVKATAAGNHDYSASDHKWLSADVVLS